MTIEQLQVAVMALMDEDELNDSAIHKIITFINMGQKEIIEQCPIKRDITIKGGDIVDGLYALPKNICKVISLYRTDKNGKFSGFTSYKQEPGGMLRIDLGSGEARLEYGVYPQALTKETKTDTSLELDEEACTALVYYVAAQMNAVEFDQRPFSTFYAMYQGRMENLAQMNPGIAICEGGGYV